MAPSLPAEKTPLPARWGEAAQRAALCSLTLSLWTLLRLRFDAWDPRLFAYALKLLASAGAPANLALGLLSAGVGAAADAPLAVAAGLSSAALAGAHLRRVTKPRARFEDAFGPDWPALLERKARPEHRAHMLRRRWSVCPAGQLPQPRFESDIAFWTLAENGQPLRCDLWRPAAGVGVSGLAVIYLHAGAWQSLDKDRYTRPFFRHLAAQGHVVMDVAYRLCHETDLFGILGDVKRAIVWLKRQASQDGFDAEKIALVGASAGGHLALLAGYAPNHSELDPPDVRQVDTSVRGVVSFYGLPDLRRLGMEAPTRSWPALIRLGQQLGLAAPQGYLDAPDLARRLFGGPPAERPARAALLSPITHVGPHCPPTLLIQGLHDHITDVEDVRMLYWALRAAPAPAIYVELPQVDHGFDLLAPNFSPAAQAALYDVERFLALLL